MFCLKLVFSSTNWMLSVGGPPWLKRWGAFLIEFMTWRMPDDTLFVAGDSVSEARLMWLLSKIVGIAGILLMRALPSLRISLSPYVSAADALADVRLSRSESDFKRPNLVGACETCWLVCCCCCCRSSKDATNLSRAIKSVGAFDFRLIDAFNTPPGAPELPAIDLPRRWINCNLFYLFFNIIIQISFYLILHSAIGNAMSSCLHDLISVARKNSICPKPSIAPHSPKCKCLCRFGSFLTLLRSISSAWLGQPCWICIFKVGVRKIFAKHSTFTLYHGVRTFFASTST